MNNIYITIGTASLRGHVVVIKRHREAEHLQDVIEIAEFEKREEAEAFMTALTAIINLSKPNRAVTI